VPRAKGWLFLTAFWATVVRVELVNLAFSIDSILVAVAMSPKTWVIISGGLLGIITMRLVIGKLLSLVRRYPALVDGAFVIIGWVGLKLLIEYLHAGGWIHFQVNKWISFGLIVVIFGASYLTASKAESVLGWQPRVRLEAGLADTFAWFAAREPQPTLTASQQPS